MLKMDQVDRIVNKAAAAVFRRGRLVRGYSQPAGSWDGSDILDVMIVVRAEKAEQITGEMALKAMVRINQDLQVAGEERIAILQFATDEELENEKLETDDVSEC